MKIQIDSFHNYFQNVHTLLMQIFETQEAHLTRRRLDEHLNQNYVGNIFLILIEIRNVFNSSIIIQICLL